MFRPVIPAIFRFDDYCPVLIAAIAQFGTPEDLLLGPAEIEHYPPPTK